MPKKPNSQSSKPAPPKGFKFDADQELDYYDYALILRSYCRGATFLDSVCADFKPQLKLPTALQELYPTRVDYKSPRYRKTHPVFNRDGKHYTISFATGPQLRVVHENEASQYKSFRDKVQEGLDKVKQLESVPGFEQTMWQAKLHGNKCQVCRTEFEDYKTHIQQKGHLQKFRSSVGWKYALDIVDTVQKRYKQSIQASNNKKKAKPKRQQSSASDSSELQSSSSRIKRGRKSNKINKQVLKTPAKKRAGTRNLLISTTNTQSASVNN